jgi:Isochorismatase family
MHQIRISPELQAQVRAERGVPHIFNKLDMRRTESTARDAMQMNYKIIFVADANAALTDAAHNATLDNMLMLFADVMTTEEVLTAVQKAR